MADYGVHLGSAWDEKVPGAEPSRPTVTVFDKILRSIEQGVEFGRGVKRTLSRPEQSFKTTENVPTSASLIGKSPMFSSFGPLLVIGVVLFLGVALFSKRGR